MKKTKKIIWALDPFTMPLKRLKTAAANIQVIAAAMDCAIEPIYILSPDGFGFTGDFSPLWIKDFQPKAETKMQQVIDKLDLETLKPKVLVNRSLSLSGDSKKLINYAKRHGAVSIYMTTQARTGLSRLMIGSFAETTLLQAKGPLIISNPSNKPIEKLKLILFSTDTSTDSRAALMKVAKIAKQSKAKIILYHKLPDPIEPVVQTGVQLAGGGWISIQQFIKKEHKAKKKQLDGWAAKVKSMGISCSVVIDDGPGFVTDSLLAQADKSKADMVALLSKSGPVSSVLIGSIGRQLARQSHLPVLVLHKDEK